MAIRAVCVHCGATVEAGEEMAGKLARCGKCLKPITVPHGDGVFQQEPFSQFPPIVTQPSSVESSRPEKTSVSAFRLGFGIALGCLAAIGVACGVTLGGCAIFTAIVEATHKETHTQQPADVAALQAGKEVERSRQAQENKQFWAPLDRQFEPSPAASIPLEPPPKYTPEMKQKMRAEAAAQAVKDEDHRRAVAEAAAVPIERAILATKAAEEKKQRLAQAIGSAPLRPWKTLGGKDASRAKISAYDHGIVTLEKPDGKTKELRVSTMMKADKDYVSQWLESAGISD